MTWLPEALKYIGSGALGAYVLTWARERRRTRDAYRAPQREAIGEIRTATNSFMLRELDTRTAMTEMTQHVRHLMAQGQAADSAQVIAATKAMGERLQTAMAAMGATLLDVDCAFSIGTLTIVDPPCFEAMGAAYIEFDAVGRSMRYGGATEMRSIEEIDQYTANLHHCATEFNKSVGALVRAAQSRVSPAEAFTNPWRRRGARRRLDEYYQRRHGARPADEPPRPHY
ncbi:hypothetical protein [Mycobacterium sp. 852002-40037_SCH5390672]|uniref:hypothetical protein n=1 Tax=Mycobacterium sp. 852002-40037_SCH5390672 TaxID=1834089 RepID=UPI0008055A29|nr:hypothetical protein [Mycobacterium sp. 852002-40037_SCH5390672]OBB94976.1 hypothetical protein A5782_08485 [Mycobacterium sp. 852002-40037_SCH5390672]